MDEALRSCGRQGSRSPEPRTETWMRGHGFHSAPGGLSPSRRDPQQPAPARPRFGPRSHLVALRGLSPRPPPCGSPRPPECPHLEGRPPPLRTHRPAPRPFSGHQRPAPSRLSRCRTAPWALPPAWPRARACWRPGAPPAPGRESGSPAAVCSRPGRPGGERGARRQGASGAACSLGRCRSGGGRT